MAYTIPLGVHLYILPHHQRHRLSPQRTHHKRGISIKMQRKCNVHQPSRKIHCLPCRRPREISCSCSISRQKNNSIDIHVPATTSNSSRSERTKKNCRIHVKRHTAPRSYPAEGCWGSPELRAALRPCRAGDIGRTRTEPRNEQG